MSFIPSRRRTLQSLAALGAAALAALSSGAYLPAPGERVGVVLCGGNVDPATLEETQ